MKKTVNLEEIVKETITPKTRVAAKFLSLLADEVKEYAKQRIVKAEAVRVAKKHSTLLEDHLNMVRTVESATAKQNGGAS